MNEVDDFLAHYGVKGMKWGVRKNRAPATLTTASNVSRQTKKAVADYNRMDDRQFKKTYSVSKTRYAKRVQKYVDPYMNSPLAKLGKFMEAEAGRNAQRYTKSTLAKNGSTKVSSLKKPEDKLTTASNVSSQTKKAVADYNRMNDQQFKNKYSVSKKQYAKRVQKYGDPYTNSPLAKIGKFVEAEAARNAQRYIKKR